MCKNVIFTLARRALLIRSFSFRRVAFWGRLWISWKRSCSSASNSFLLSAIRSGWAQNEPMYTRTTSGVLMIFPSDHMRAPYTLISCWVLIWSALFRTTRILSSWFFSALITSENSSEMSSLWASNSKMIRSTRSANHSRTAAKS